MHNIQNSLQEGDGLGAFADGIGLVVQDVTVAFPLLEHIFTKFASISNLYLNLPKFHLVPLCLKAQLPDFIADFT